MHERVWQSIRMELRYRLRCSTSNYSARTKGKKHPSENHDGLPSEIQSSFFPVVAEYPFDYCDGSKLRSAYCIIHRRRSPLVATAAIWLGLEP